MAVEILILSGVRAGQQVVITSGEFRAGAGADCEVFFDPRQEAAAAGSSVLFRLMDDGWYAQPTGPGDIFVNQDLLAGRTRMRSGDVVRMSPQGPDFSFTIVAHAPASTAGRGPVAEALSAPAVELGSILPTAGHTVPPAVPPAIPPAAMPAATPAFPPPGSPLVSLAVPEDATVPEPAPSVEKISALRLACIGGGVLAVLLVVVLLAAIALRDRGPAVVKTEDPKAAQGPTTAPSIPASPAKLEVAKAGGSATLPPSPPPPPAKPDEEKATKPADAEETVRDAVYLVEVEISHKLLPFATCCAINETTLLTSAREAAQLVYWRKSGVEQRILVCNQKGVKREVEEIRALRSFGPRFVEESLKRGKKSAAAPAEPAADGKPPELLYFDVALLTVAEKLPAFASLASPEDLQALKDGETLLCLGYAHDATMISNDELPPLQSGKGTGVFLITTIPSPAELPPVGGPPRLLHVKGEIPTRWMDDPVDPAAKGTVPLRPYGSPLFNAQGKLVAIYGDTPPKGDRPMLLHLAPVVNPELIGRWLRGEADHTEDIQTWTLPDLFSTPAPTSRKP